MFLIVGLLAISKAEKVAPEGIPAEGSAVATTLIFFAFFLFVFAAFTDWWDGWYARRRKVVSDFGKLMDALADKILMVGLFVGFLWLNILPGWAIWGVLIILTREFFVTGLRLVAVTKGVVLAAERSGKIKTVLQIIAAGVLILAYGFKGLEFESASEWAKHLQHIGNICFGIAVFLTFTSGTGYLIKYRGLLKESL